MMMLSRSGMSANIRILCLALTVALGIGACGGAPAIVPDAEGVENVSAVGMGCNKPYKLTQDCSGFSGATRRIQLSGAEFKIAGSEDGAIVLMMGAKQISDAASGKSSESANIAFEVTKDFLVRQGVRITLVEPVASGSLLAGYIITTDGDSYAMLREHTVEK